MPPSQMPGVLPEFRGAQTASPEEITALVELLASDISSDFEDEVGWPLDESAIRQRLTNMLSDDFTRFRRLLAKLLAFLAYVRQADVVVRDRYAGMIQLAELARGLLAQSSP